MKTLDTFRPMFHNAHREPFITYRDWTAPFLDLEAIRLELGSFGEMLLYEVEAASMPRNWLRWALEFAQTAARVEPGNPRDGQLSAYLPDADLFLTNDNRFARLLAEVRAVAPTTIAETRFVGITDKDASACEAIEAHLTG